MAKASQCGKCAGCKKNTMCTVAWTEAKNIKISLGNTKGMTSAQKKASSKANIKKGR